MKIGRNRIVHKHYRLDASKIKRAQKLMMASSETETIDRALDAVIDEHKRNLLTHQANQRFAGSGIEIRDVFGKLAE